MLHPYFGEIFAKICSESTDISIPIGLYLFGLILIYTVYTPYTPEELPEERLLILSHNALHVYGQAALLFYGVDIKSRHQKQTSAANLPKKEASKLAIDKIESYRKKHIKGNPRFAALSYSQQAGKISRDLKKEDFEIAIRTIRRKLASCT